MHKLTGLICVFIFLILFFFVKCNEMKIHNFNGPTFI